MSNDLFGLKKNNASQRNCQDQLSHPSLSDIELEYQESLIFGKDLYSTKFEWRPWIYVKLKYFLCYSKLFGMHPLDNMAIIHWVKNMLKQKGKLWVHETPILEVIFVALTEDSSIVTDDTQDLGNIQTHGNAWHGTKTTSVLLPADGEAPCLLLPSLVFLPSGGTFRKHLFL